MNNIVMLAAVDAEEAARKADGTLEDRARAAMQATHHHWLCTNENEQFVAACEGLARVVSEEDRERIEDDLRGLSRASALLNALSAGVPVDWEQLSEEAEAKKAAPPSLGLKKLWHEVTA